MSRYEVVRSNEFNGSVLETTASSRFGRFIEQETAVAIHRLESDGPKIGLKIDALLYEYHVACFAILYLVDEPQLLVILAALRERKT